MFYFRIVFINIFIIFYSCKQEAGLSLPREGLVAEIPLDGFGYDRFRKVYALNNGAVPRTNRFGLPGRAMQFDDSAYLDFGDAGAYSFPANVFTLSCWILPQSPAGTMCIASKREPGSPFEYSIDNHMDQSVFSFDNWIADGSTTVYGTDPLNASVPWETEQWMHVTWVADGVHLTAYVNGEEVAGMDSVKEFRQLADTGAAFRIGNGGGFGKDYFFKGGIDDVFIYHRALRPDEIRLLAGHKP